MTSVKIPISRKYLNLQCGTFVSPCWQCPDTAQVVILYPPLERGGNNLQHKTDPNSRSQVGCNFLTKLNFTPHLHFRQS